MFSVNNMNMQQMNSMNQQPMNNFMYPQSQSQRYKTQLCRHFKNGNCNLKDTCHFAHGIHELRGQNDPVPQQLPVIQPIVQTNNFKTIQCKYFQNGYCKNTFNCSFAHGEQDQRAQMPMMGGMPMQVIGYPQQQMMIHQMPTRMIQVPISDYSQQMPNQDPNTQILIIILQNMERIFPDKPDIIQQIKKSQQLAHQGQQQQATQIIMTIMEDTTRTDQEISDYQKIYSNAKIYYSDLLSKQQQVQQQQQVMQTLQFLQTPTVQIPQVQRVFAPQQPPQPQPANLKLFQDQLTSNPLVNFQPNNLSNSNDIVKELKVDDN